MAAKTFQEFADDLAAISPKPPVQERRQTFDSLQRYTPAGEAIPLDTETGAPFMSRLRASLVSDEPTKKAIFSEAFSGAKVEAIKSRHGDSHMVIRDYRDPETGQIKDILVDEKGASLKDLADLGEVGVQLLSTYAALRGGRPLTTLAPAGLARTAAESAIASIAGEAGAGVAEGTMRAYEDQPVQPGEIMKRRSAGAALGTALDLGVTAPVLVGTKIGNLRRGIPKSEEAFNALQSRDRLAADTGIYVDFSLGEATGSQSLREREQLLRAHILGGGRLEVQKRAQTSSIQQIQETLPGTFGVPGEQLPSKDVVGTQAVSALRSLTDAAAEGTARARAAAISEATVDLGSAMQTSTGFANRQVLQDEAGDLARKVVNLKHDVLNEIEGELKDEALKLGADQPFVATPQAKQKVNSIVENAYEKPGKRGKMLETTPASVLRVLEDVRNLPAQITWDEMRRVRTSVNRLINEGQILGDTDTGVLKQISSTLTEAINRGATTLSPNASAAVLRANKFYAQGIEGFQVKGITDILADPSQRKLGPFAIFNQAAGDPDQYFRLKNALTKPLMLEGKVADAASAQAGENAWNVFKQGMWDQMTDGSMKAANRSMLDPAKLLNKLDPAVLPLRVREDLLGPQGEVIIRSLKRLEVLDNPKLPADEALAILRQGGDTMPDQILQLARREKELDKLYANQVIKKFSKGDIGAESIEPGQFVDRFAESGPIPDVRDTMNKLEMASPGMTRLVRSKQVQSILESSARSPLDSSVSAKKLATQIGGQDKQERLKAVLGEPGLRRLNDLLTMLAYLQPEKTSAISMGGSLAGGEAKSKMLLVYRAIKSFPAQVQYRVAAMLITNPNLYRKVTGPVQPLDPSKLIRGLILTDEALLDLGAETIHFILGTDNDKPSRQPTQTEFEKELNR